jgi:GntR family transcriptional regulator
MNWTIDTRSAVPIFQQIVRGVKIEVLSGRLGDGDPLPSIRDLARFLKINPNTVAKAYYILEEEGFVTGRVGSGSRVRVPRSGNDKLRRSILEEELRGFLDKAFSLGFSRDDIRKSLAEVLDHE